MEPQIGITIMRDAVDPMTYCHIGVEETGVDPHCLCGFYNDVSPVHETEYDGESICPECGKPTCPQCAVQVDLEMRLRS